MKTPRIGIATALLAAGVSIPTMASNYSVGGPNQDRYFLPNWGENGQTITIFPSLEGMTTVTAGPPGSKPAHMVPDPAGKHIFAITHGGNSMFVHDAKTGELIKQITTGSERSEKGQGHQYYWSPDGKFLYVTELDDDAVVEIDAEKLEVSRRAENVADFPFGMVPAWSEGYLYVVGEGPGPVEVERPGTSVTQFDLATFKPVKEIQVGKAPHAAAYSNGKVYVGNIAKGHRSVSVIDATQGDVVKTIDVDYENPHFLEEPTNDNHLMIVASKEVPELVLIDDRRSRTGGAIHLRAVANRHTHASVERRAQSHLCRYRGQRRAEHPPRRIRVCGQVQRLPEEAGRHVRGPPRQREDRRTPRHIELTSAQPWVRKRETRRVSL